MQSLSKEQKIYYTLRFAAAMCFIGHGAFGIITKKIWLNYLAVFGIGPVMGYHLMPWLGAVDILFGISLLVYPTRAVLLWLVIWGTVTAFLRPLSGEPFAETIERAGNYGAPLALLLLFGTGGKTIKGWLTVISANFIPGEKALANVAACLRVVVFLLLAGHGWLNLLEKKGMLDQYASLGFSRPALIAQIVGILEIIAALTVLSRPFRPMLITLLIWKMGTELLYPHWEAFEWIERGGSYGCILALLFMLPQTSTRSQSTPLAGLVASTLVLFSSLLYLSHRNMIVSNSSENMPQPVDKPTLDSIMSLDRKNNNATFVFVNEVPGADKMHNRVIQLPPIGDELRIDFDKYVHKGHNGPLFIILPDSYAGPKEKFVLKSFPDYKGWYASMLSDKYVMYAAK